FVIPDGLISLALLTLNLPLAAIGSRDRARFRPGWSLLASVKAGGEALGAGWYFAQMPLREKAWCGYCIIGAVANWAVFLLTLPEARRALEGRAAVRRSSSPAAAVG